MATEDSPKRKTLRIAVSTVIGLASGAVIGFPVSFYIGNAIVNILNVSDFEGGAGYAVLLVMMIGIPAIAFSVALLNALLSIKGWPIKTVGVELALGILSVIVTRMSGIS